MKTIVIGSNGMLGSDVVATFQNEGHEVFPLDLPAIDIADYDNVIANLPYGDLVINCAAYTRVDDAEQDRDAAYRVNCEGARNLARACLLRSMCMVHISTDYVFDGNKTRPYDESDVPNPLGIYASSKLAGEKAVRAEAGRFMIIRTQALFGIHGHNFVKAILKKLRAGEPLKVVNDQAVSPTFTMHLAEAIFRLINTDKEGIVHVSGGGKTTWFDFARAIAEYVKEDATIEPIKAEDLSLPAKRPMNSVFDMTRYEEWTGHPMPTWEQGLDEYMRFENL